MTKLKQIWVGRGQRYGAVVSDRGSEAIGHTHHAAGPVVVARPQSPGPSLCIDRDGVVQSQFDEVKEHLVFIDAGEPNEVVDNLTHAYRGQ